MADISREVVNTRDHQSPLDVEPIAGRIGAIIHGVKLSGTLDKATVDAIWAAVTRHKVVFFRDQDGCNDEAQQDFAALMGPPINHPTIRILPGTRSLLAVDAKEGLVASAWHTDMTYIPNYPAASILRSVVIPEIGGDTLWANTATAYEALPDHLKALVANLRAVHTNSFNYADFGSSQSEGTKAQAAQVAREFTANPHETEHPVVAVHPITGEKTILLGRFVSHLVGLSKTDSQNIVQLLQDHISKPENTVRWRWRENDVVIWDNHATQHRAIADFGVAERRLRRVTLGGRAAVGLNGVASLQIKPEPALAAE